jgi:hypothetical protein
LCRYSEAAGRSDLSDGVREARVRQSMDINAGKQPPPVMKGKSLSVVAGRLASAVAFTRQRNGVQRRDHNRRFRACLHRRKNTLANLLLSEDGISRLCTALALMLQQLLLGRSVQAAPAQPSLPGWLLLVEDSDMLDALSMGLVRACLEHCSIPLVVLMCHQSRGRRTTSSGSEDSHLMMMTSPMTRRVPGKSDSNTSTMSSKSSSNSSGSLRAEAGQVLDDVWGAQLYSETARSHAVAAAAATRMDLRWMLELPTSTRITLTNLSQSDTRVLVEHRAAAVLLASASGAGGDGGEGGDGDADASGSGGGDGDGPGDAASEVGSEASGVVAATPTVGLPSSLHAAVYAQTHGNPLFAALVTDVLASTGAVSVVRADNRNEVTIARGEKKGRPSAARLTGMSFKEVVLENVNVLLPEDAALALRALTACGDSFSAAHACEVVQRRLAVSERAKAAAENSNNIPEGGSSNSNNGPDAAGGTGSPRVSDVSAVDVAFQAVEYAPRAVDALGDLMARGLLSAEWGSMEDVLNAALVSAGEAQLEFSAVGHTLPLDEPKCLETFAGVPRGGVGNRGRLARFPCLCFTNSSIRQVIYAATPLRERRDLHLDAVAVLRREATRAEDSLGDPAAAALLHEQTAHHLSLVHHIDRQAVATMTNIRRGGVSGGVYSALGVVDMLRGGSFGSASLAPDLSGIGEEFYGVIDGANLNGGGGVVITPSGCRSSGVSLSGSGFGGCGGFGDVGAGEIVAAVPGLETRVQCHEDATRAHLRRGNMRLALTSISSAGVAAATWVDFSPLLRKTFARSHPTLTSSGAVLSSDDSAALMVRNAAWAVLASRITLDIGDGHPPLLVLASEVDGEAPLRSLRRGLFSLHRKWPFAGVTLRDYDAAQEGKLAAGVQQMLSHTAIGVHVSVSSPAEAVGCCGGGPVHVESS